MVQDTVIGEATKNPNEAIGKAANISNTTNKTKSTTI